MIYLVRHGQTQWNHEKRFQGQQDSPLTELGRDQAVNVGCYLAFIRGLEAPYEIFCSPLGRARQTFDVMRVWASGFIPVYFDDRLMERAFGDWEGKLYKETYPTEQYKEYEKDKYGYKGSGESYSDVVDRLSEFWDHHLKDHMVVISHGACNAMSLMILCGTLFKDRYIPKNDELCIIDPKTREFWVKRVVSYQKILDSLL